MNVFVCQLCIPVLINFFLSGDKSWWFTYIRSASHVATLAMLGGEITGVVTILDMFFVSEKNIRFS